MDPLIDMNILIMISLEMSRPYGYDNIFTRCAIRNQFIILLTAIADFRKRQTDM